MAFVLAASVALPARRKAHALASASPSTRRRLWPVEPWVLHRELPPMPREELPRTHQIRATRGATCCDSRCQKGAPMSPTRRPASTEAQPRDDQPRRHPDRPTHFYRAFSTAAPGTALTHHLRQSRGAGAPNPHLGRGPPASATPNLAALDAELRNFELYTRARKIFRLCPARVLPPSTSPPSLAPRARGHELAISQVNSVSPKTAPYGCQAAASASIAPSSSSPRTSR